MWIFAYGSLIFRPSFEFVEKRRAYVRGWTRRFWQGSPDHRGVPGAPGRVVTLVPNAEASCGGCAYRIDPRRAEEILSALDVREQAGFVRHDLALHESLSGVAPFASGITWVAAESNEHFLGPLPEREIAATIRERRGPSGTNTEYAVRLLQALRALGVTDEHVEAVGHHLLGANGAP